MDLGFFQILALIMAVMGAGQFLVGVSQSRSRQNEAQFISRLMQCSGLGWLAGAAIFYWGGTQDWPGKWPFLPSAVCVVAGFCAGTLTGRRFLKPKEGPK